MSGREWAGMAIIFLGVLALGAAAVTAALQGDQSWDRPAAAIGFGLTFIGMVVAMRRGRDTERF
ncbi:MAG TPA: hypothetical protein VFK89_05405 [Actinomycetota bacterium]|nr:hypothetical protein [Actinomycetota bacterium]